MAVLPALQLLLDGLKVIGGLSLAACRQRIGLRT